MQLFHQAGVPANQNLLYKTAEAAKNASCGELDIHCDEDTGLIRYFIYVYLLPEPSFSRE